MQNRKDSLILKQKGNYIPLLKHGESVQVNEERGYCCPRTAKTGNLYRKKNRQSQEPIMPIGREGGEEGVLARREGQAVDIFAA